MIKEILIRALEAIAARIKEPVHRDIESTAQRIPKSSALVESSLRVLNDSLRTELLQLIEDISRSEIKLREVDYFHESLIEFIDDQYNKHISYLKRINLYNIGDRDYSGLINELQSDLKSKIEIKLAIIKQDIKRKIRKGILEVGRMVLSAIIGGLIGWGIKVWTG
ncbi:hypothetical protein PAECIP112173_02337 [Paenibacillus sp. JJ-100]|uniref:hypothetical protein n=1 Tax=Paenibacillus sp. JJ-100 TaxID=2974896 RepID=UPI0022FF9E6D|nr:hypothetical protein [Paenibacillus sp. JJ-100]CAI6074640.1 hypothetical protein PAECIP112173_02337 [Paenibacillus sp. JJ-100]